MSDVGVRQEDDVSTAQRWTSATTLTLAMVAIAGAITAPVWAEQTGLPTARTTLVSLGARGQAHGGQSYSQDLSRDGRFVAFQSDAPNLVRGDTNHSKDVFVRDLRRGTTERVSIGENGQADAGSNNPAISGDGRFVVFQSAATNLVAEDTNRQRDIFLRDRRLGTTELVSVGMNGAANGRTWSEAAVSDDGRYVAFTSEASDIVEVDTNGNPDVFLRDRQLGTTELVSVAMDGAANGRSYLPALSADGRYVAFFSEASNLVPDDTNDDRDTFVRDRESGTTERVNLGPGGVQGDGGSQGCRPAISADGRFVVFESVATNLVAEPNTSRSAQVFVRDRAEWATELVSLGDEGPGIGDSCFPDVSDDGRFVAFESTADALVPEDKNGEGADVFIRDRVAGTTTLASVGWRGQGKSDNYHPSLSGDGRFVAFDSFSSNLVRGDDNGKRDVFVRGPLTDAAILAVD
jgi:Tol biopolymer transport system component